MHEAATAGHKQKPARSEVAANVLHRGVICLVLVLMAVLAVAWWVSARSSGRVFTYNGFALLSATSFISSGIAFGFLERVKQRSDTLMWFGAFTASISTWALAEMLQRFSATPAAASFWAPATTLGPVLMPTMLYMFAVSYTRPKQSTHPYLFSTMILISAAFIYLDARTTLFTHYHVLTHTAWGYMPETGSWYGLIPLWDVLVPLATIGQFYLFRKRTSDVTLRKQARLFMIAIAIPLIGGSVTDGILPVLKLDVLPSVSSTLLTVTSIMICYGIVRYRLFSFTPTLVASEVLSTMNEAVIGVRSDLKISYVNAWAETMLGLPAAKLSDRTFTDFLEQAMSPEAFRQDLESRLAGHHFTTIESVRLVAPDQLAATVKLSVTKLDDRSQPYGYLIVMSDITALVDARGVIEQQVTERTRQLHEEQAKLRASIEGLPLGFMLLDPDGHIVVQNPVLDSIFEQQTPFKDLRDVQAMLVDTDVAAAVEEVRAAGRAADMQEVGMRAKVLRLFIAPVKIAEGAAETVIGTVILVQDITEEKILSRSKDEFFSIASHELRTPLTAIKGNASMMIDYYKELLDQDASFREMVLDIHTSSDRLIEIVNDFLDVSRIEQGKMTFHFEPVALDKVIEFVFYEMRAVLREKSIGLTTDTQTLGQLPPVWADRDRVVQIIYNLVGNAVKFTEQGSVTVHTEVGDGQVYIRVSDTGRGVPLENQKLLFHKFQQAGDSLLTRDTTRGTGLGLYISKLLAESMHGELELEYSEEGKGSTFRLTLPLARPGQQAEPEASAAATDATTGLTEDASPAAPEEQISSQADAAGDKPQK